jgi:hypothetical protein
MWYYQLQNLAMKKYTVIKGEYVQILKQLTTGAPTSGIGNKSILSHINPFHTTSSSLSKIHLNVMHPPSSLSS